VNLSAQTSEPGSPESLRTKDLIKKRTGCSHASRHQDPKTGTAKTDDDDSRVPLLAKQEKLNPAEQYSQRVDQFRETILSKFRGRADEEFLNAALDVVDQRAWDRRTRIASPKFFEVSLENFLQNEREVTSLKTTLQRKRELRDRYMPGFNAADHSTTPDPEFIADVRFAIAESERTGAVADDILRERRAMRAAR